MAKDFSLADVKFRETGHIAFADDYITSYVSTDIVPKIYMSVNTPRDATGLVSGKPKRYYRTRYAALIDKISGKGTWENNPWVFVYDFELVK